MYIIEDVSRMLGFSSPCKLPVAAPVQTLP